MSEITSYNHDEVENIVYSVYLDSRNGKDITVITKLNEDELLKEQPDAYYKQYQNNLLEFAYVKDLESAISMSYVPVNEIEFVNIDNKSIKEANKKLQEQRNKGIEIKPKYIVPKNNDMNKQSKDVVKEVMAKVNLIKDDNFEKKGLGE